MANVGDILEFKKPLREFHAQYLPKGAQYVVRQEHKYKPAYKDADGWWHVDELPELAEKRIFFCGKNFSMDCGKLKNYSDYKVIGNVYNN